MTARTRVLTAPAARPPRAMVWVLLLASAGAVLLVGLVATTLLLGDVAGSSSSIAWRLWPRFLAACGLVVISLSLRSLRWIFLLRRAETRIPIRDAYIGYIAGFSLLLTPLLVGEIAVRAAINRRRGGVPIGTTVIVNVFERVMDATALAVLAGGATLIAGAPLDWTVAVMAATMVTFITPLRRQALTLLRSLAERATRRMDAPALPALGQLGETRTWVTGFATSLVAWMLPGVAFWILLRGTRGAFGVAQGIGTYAGSSVVSALSLAPGGVLVSGRQLLATLMVRGLSEPDAVVTVAALRLATVGVSVALGVMFLVFHWRSAAASSETHFDDIADAYDVQIPEARRFALLERKTALMKNALQSLGSFTRGLDVGCGQGAYVARMRTLGFDVRGIDASAGQVRLASRNVGEPGVISSGSALEIPAADGSFDFLYVINVLHHLGSVDEQRRAFAEMLRVLRPGGVLFVHEINTRNILFRFYMGYVFPSLNCIDEGVERWLLPHQFSRYTDARVEDVHYFTFLPDFVPGAVASLLAPLERMLEGSALRVYSAHYMAVLRKSA